MSRAAILSALRAAQAAAPITVPAPPPRPASVPVQSLEGGGAWARLRAVLEPLDVRLRLARTPDEAARLVAEIARERGAKSYLRWEAMPASVDIDAALSELERVFPEAAIDGRPCPKLGQVDLGITAAHAALVESGSIVAVAGPDTPRAASLLPAVHLCLLPRAVLLPDVSALPDLLNSHRDANGNLPSCLNLISGPSSTADIELVLVRGAHGPVAVEIIGLDWDE